MEPFAGSLGALGVASVYLATSRLVLDPTWISQMVTLTGIPVWGTALAIHITCWIAQFVGHGIFEGIIYILCLYVIMNCSINYKVMHMDVLVFNC